MAYIAPSRPHWTIGGHIVDYEGYIGLPWYHCGRTHQGSTMGLYWLSPSHPWRVSPCPIWPWFVPFGTLVPNWPLVAI